MNPILYNLLRLSLLVALMLTPSVAPLASAQEPQLAQLPCLPGPTLAKITGTVRDGNGQPIAGVDVTAHAIKNGISASDDTNAAGEYGIPLQPGSYVLEFRSAQSAFQAAFYKSTSSPLGATPVEVGSGETVSGIDIKLSAGAQFGVTLRDPEGAPVPEGHISVFDRYGRRVATGQTDNAGQTRTVPGLPPGSYRLLAHPAYGSPLLEQYANEKSTLDDADLITVTQVVSVELALSLPRGAQLSGTVTDATNGAPLAGIAVHVRNAGNVVRDAMTNDAGHYSIVGLPSGTYQVEFESNQSTPASPAPLRRVVTLTAPTAQAGFDAALIRGGTISGLVTTPDGAPISGASVSVHDVDDTMSIHGFTADDGTYAIGGLPSGRYTLTVGHYSYQGRALPDQVTVTAPNTTMLPTTVLTSGGAISGKVVGPDGAPVEGVYVLVVDAATGKPQEGSVYTNAAGVYTTRPTLANGSYIVKFQPPNGYGLCSLAIEYSGNASTTATATRVQVSGPATVTGIDAALENGLHISGHITEAGSGLPLNSSVEVYDATGALVTNGYGSLGHYRTSAALPPGNYRVRFVADSYVSMFYGGATVLEAAAKVPSGADDINMVLPRGGTLSGRVTAADSGAPLEYAAVTLYGAGDRVIATKMTTFDGSYSFKGALPSGIYRIGVAPGQRNDGTPYFTGYQAVFSGGASSLAQAQSISLVAPKTISVDLAMPSTSAPPPPPPPPPPPGAQSVYLPLMQR
jgi:hypothetical protein